MVLGIQKRCECGTGEQAAYAAGGAAIGAGAMLAGVAVIGLGPLGPVAGGLFAAF